MKDVGLKNEAIALRQQGWSYPMITAKLGVAKGTLNYWFKDIALSEQVLAQLKTKKQENIQEMRKKAMIVNRRIVEKRINRIFALADEKVGQAKFNQEIYEQMFAMLYLCEGSKSIETVMFANSNADIIKLYLVLLCKVFIIKSDDLMGYLHLRADQNSEDEIKYWSGVTHIPIKNFGKSQLDTRTLGKKTRLGYHGVCAVSILSTEKGRWIRDYSGLLIQRLIVR